MTEIFTGYFTGIAKSGMRWGANKKFEAPKK